MISGFNYHWKLQRIINGALWFILNQSSGIIKWCPPTSSDCDLFGLLFALMTDCQVSHNHTITILQPSLLPSPESQQGSCQGKLQAAAAAAYLPQKSFTGLQKQNSFFFISPAKLRNCLLCTERRGIPMQVWRNTAGIAKTQTSFFQPNAGVPFHAWMGATCPPSAGSIFLPSAQRPALSFRDYNWESWD